MSKQDSSEIFDSFFSPKFKIDEELIDKINETCNLEIGDYHPVYSSRDIIKLVLEAYRDIDKK